LGGYSTICLARALNENGKLISIEIDQKFAKVAAENISKAKLSDKVEIKVCDALTILPELEKEIIPVDLFFIDAYKTQYTAYFDWALKMARKGTILIQIM